MSEKDLSRQLVARLAAALGDGTLDPTAPGAPNVLAQTWSAIEERLAGDRLAGAALLLFASETGSADLQGRLAQALAKHVSADELRALLDRLDGGAPAVRSRILADKQARITDSGHKVIAPPGSVDLETRAGEGAIIEGSGITIVGAAGPVPRPARPSLQPPGWGPLPTTLSADGTHFSYGHALVIGVGQYRDPKIRDVPTTARDANGLAALLRDPQLAGYPDAQVRVLADAQASRANILAALDELAERAAQSTALIFFAGHGEPVGDGYALLPHDALLADLAATGITAALFHERIAQIRANAKRLIVLLNCCHAGGVGDEVLGEPDEGTLSGAAPPPEFYRPLAVGSGQVVISSSRPNQKSGARSRHDPQHTTFGAHLLEALRGTAPGAGPVIGVFDLFAHLRAAVPPDARMIPYLGKPLVQEPLFYASQLDDNIPVALRPGGPGGTLSADESLVARLVALELEIESLGEAAPAELRADRDAALARIERG